MVNTVYDLFLQSVAKAGEDLFLINNQRQLTYKAVFTIAAQRAHRLQQEGAMPRDRVLIVDDDPLETVLWCLACSLIGVVFVIIHRTTFKRRLNYFLADADPVGIIDTRPGYADLYQDYPHLSFALTATEQDEDIPLQETFSLPEAILATDPAFFIYTSGSTGKPKAVICPHHAVLAATTSINTYLGTTATDRIGHHLSLSFVYGLFQILLAMQVQASVCFLAPFRSPLELLTQLKEKRITALPTVRPVLVGLSRITIEQQQIETLRYITSTGDHIPPATIEAILYKFCGVQYFYMYGLTECARALYMAPDKVAQKLTSVGRPIPGTRASIVDEKGQRVAVGDIGELWVEGPHVMSGYWNAPEETTSKFTQDIYGQRLLCTGDLFFQDSEGDFHYVGRKNELIKSRGFRISPREVELAILTADPDVQECMVYGIEDAVLGQAICAKIITTHPSHTMADIFTLCRAHIEPYLLPTKIEIVDAFPTTTSGKYFRRPSSTHGGDED